MLTKTHAIVLRTIKYGESSLIADTLTEAMGRIAFMIRISKTTKAKVKKQFFQPLTLLDLEFDYRQKARLQYLKDVRIALPYVSISFEPTKSCILLFLAEFLYYVTRNEQKNIPLYKYVKSSLAWLDGAQSGFANFHLVFMMRLSRFVGFFPNFDDFFPGTFFDLRSGGFCQNVPLHPDYLMPQEAERVGKLMRMDYETMHLFRLSRSERNRIAALALYYYRLHVPDMPELQSFSVLQEIFV